MMKYGRDILVLLKNEFMTEHDIQMEIEHLDILLKQVENAESFCVAHELVNRNQITSNKKKIIRETRHFTLKPFRFIINKN